MAPTRTKTQAPFAVPKGRWILKTEASKKYKLSTADLDTLLPVSKGRNPYGGSSAVVRYNLCDVEALAQHIRSSSSDAPPPTEAVELAEPNGSKILLSKAKAMYPKLKNEHLNQIKPVSMHLNPHGGPYPMKYYNLCDVKELAEQLGLDLQPPKTPSPSKAKRAQVASPSSCSAASSFSKSSSKTKRAPVLPPSPDSTMPSPPTPSPKQKEVATETHDADYEIISVSSGDDSDVECLGIVRKHK